MGSGAAGGRVGVGVRRRWPSFVRLDDLGNEGGEPGGPEPFGGSGVGRGRRVGGAVRKGLRSGRKGRVGGGRGGFRWGGGGGRKAGSLKKLQRLEGP